MESLLFSRLTSKVHAIIQHQHSNFGEETVEGPPISPWSFSSKQRDKDLGLIHYGKRFYISTLSRWLILPPQASPMA